MNENKITTLFLDIGGVLLSNGWGHLFRNQAADKFNLDTAEMEMRHKLLFVIYEEGRVTLNEYLNRVVFYESRNFTMQQFKDFMFSLTTANQDMIALIKKLKVKYNLKVIAVSNEAEEMNAYRIKKFHLNSFIDFFVSSCYVHVRKPDATIFKLAIDFSQVALNEIIYIDDVKMFVEVAKDAGITGIDHLNYSSTAKKLADFGLVS